MRVDELSVKMTNLKYFIDLVIVHHSTMKYLPKKLFN